MRRPITMSQDLAAIIVVLVVIGGIVGAELVRWSTGPVLTCDDVPARGLDEVLPLREVERAEHVDSGTGYLSDCVWTTVGWRQADDSHGIGVLSVRVQHYDDRFLRPGDQEALHDFAEEKRARLDKDPANDPDNGGRVLDLPELGDYAYGVVHGPDSGATVVILVDHTRIWVSFDVGPSTSDICLAAAARVATALSGLAR